MPRGDGKATTPTKTGRGRAAGHAGDTAHKADADANGAPGRFITTRVEIEGREQIRIVERPAFELPPWSTDGPLSVVGQRVPRVDALEKVTGRARYTTDIQRPGTLHVAILRAPIARGRVTRIDLAPALSLPGVRDGVTRADLPTIDIGGVPLLDPTVHYAAQPIAALCADSEELARDALRHVVVEYAAEPHAVTVEDALAPGAPLVRPGGNRSRNSPKLYERGDAAKGLRDADVVVTREYRTPVALHSALEPHGAVAEWAGDQLTVWESTQGIFNTREDLANAFGLPMTQVRVIKDYMGGGFGAKNGASTNAYLAAALARRTGRPVSCINERDAEQMDSGNRPATVQRVSLGARRDGTLTAIVLEAQIPLGIGGWQGGPAKIYHELYSCPNVHTSETYAYINASAMASFRAPGHAEGAFGLERAMDTLAAALGMDPLALRVANYATTNVEKLRPYTSKRLDECYRMGAERFGWTRGAAPALHSSIRRGRGMASLTWGAGGGPPAYALVRLNPDASADVLTGSQDLGTGTRTVLAQVAAEALGARLADVRVILGDTERTPYTGNSWGSMTVASVAPAVRMAAVDARRELFAAAAAMLSVDASQLDARDSVIRARGDGASITFADVGAKLGDVMIIGRGSRGPNPDDAHIAAFGAQFAEVEVDVETGIVRVLRIVSVHDSGRILNPTLAESQVEGGIIQGIGYALFEERVLDRTLGIPLNPTLHDYKIPTMCDIPLLDVLFVEHSDDQANHVGAKGLAEPPIIPTAPAIANAVADALGVEVNEIPLTPWRVRAAIGA